MTQAVQPTSVEFDLPITGAATVPWRYLAGAEHTIAWLDATGNVLSNGIADDDFIITPSGNTLANVGVMALMVPPPIGAVSVRLSSLTTPRQDWVSTVAGRGIEAQLDRHTRVLQELMDLSEGAIRITTPTRPLVPVPNGVLVFGADGQPQIGPVLGDIVDPQINAAQARAAATEAEAFAAQAANAAANFSVPSIAALKALVPEAGQTAYLTADHREGTFTFRAGNYTAAVLKDALNGVYVKANSIAASAGAWVRHMGREFNARPQWWGATGGGLWLQDGAMTAGSAVLTSATAGFTAGDVGKMVKVGRAGTAGATLITAITGYTSATQVTLAANAAVTVSGVNFTFGVNDRAAIVAARDFALSFPGKGIVLSDGTYCCDGVLDLAFPRFSTLAEGPEVWIEAFHAGIAISLDGHAAETSPNAGVQNITFGGAYRINIRGHSGTTHLLYTNSLFRSRVCAYGRDCSSTAFFGEKGPGSFGMGVLTHYDLQVSNAAYGDMDVRPPRAFEFYDTTDCFFTLIGEDCGSAAAPMAAILQNCVRGQYWGSIEGNTHGGLHVMGGSLFNQFNGMHNEFNGPGYPDFILAGHHNLLFVPHGRAIPATVTNEFNGNYNIIFGGEFDYVIIGASAIYNEFRNTKFFFAPVDLNGTTKFKSCVDSAGNPVLDNGFSPQSIVPTVFSGTFAQGGGGFKNFGYWRDDQGLVHLEGTLSTGANASPTTICTLPVGYRPPARQDFNIPNSSLGTTAQIRIDASGIITLTTGAGADDFVSFNGIYFKRA